MEPPFHEQVQAVVYMKLTGSMRALLIQHFPIQTNPSSDQLKVTALTLDSFHAKAWEEEILPRLELFAAAIQNIRQDDVQRMRWLVLSETEQIDLLKRLLPYIP